MTTIYETLQVITIGTMATIAVLPAFTMLVLLCHQKEKRAKYFIGFMAFSALEIFIFLMFANLIGEHANYIYSEQNPKAECIILLLCDYIGLLVIVPVWYSILKAGRSFAIKLAKTKSTRRACVSFGNAIADDMDGTTSGVKKLKKMKIKDLFSIDEVKDHD